MGQKKKPYFIEFNPKTEPVPNGHKDYPIKAKVTYVLFSSCEKLTEVVTLEVSE